MSFKKRQRPLQGIVKWYWDEVDAETREELLAIRTKVQAWHDSLTPEQKALLVEGFVESEDPDAFADALFEVVISSVPKKFPPPSS